MGTGSALELGMDTMMTPTTTTKTPQEAGCPIATLHRLAARALIAADAAGLALCGRAQIEQVAAAVKAQGGIRSAANLAVLRSAWALAH